MNKPLLFLMIFIGSTVASFIPGLWHAGAFSVWGLAFSVFGAIAGIFVAAWITSNYLE